MGVGLEIFHIFAAFFTAIGIADFFYEMFRLLYRRKAGRKNGSCPEGEAETEVRPDR